MQINQLSMAQRLPVYGHPRGESVMRRRIFRLIRLPGGISGIGGPGSLGTIGWKARARGSNLTRTTGMKLPVVQRKSISLGPPRSNLDTKPAGPGQFERPGSALRWLLEPVVRDASSRLRKKSRFRKKRP